MFAWGVREDVVSAYIYRSHLFKHLFAICVLHIYVRSSVQFGFDVRPFFLCSMIEYFNHECNKIHVCIAISQTQIEKNGCVLQM